MKRLIEQEIRHDSAERWLAELVWAMPRLPDAPLERERILARVARQAGVATIAVAWMSPESKWIWGSTAAAALIASVAAAAIYGAATPRRAAPSAPARTSTPIALVEKEEPAGLPSTGSSTPSDASAQVPPAAPSATPTLPARAQSAAPPAPRRSPPESEDPTPVLEAIRALRSQGDAERASTLLAQYLAANPHGVLTEDAIALSVESAIARHDSRAAGDWARRYLGQFPHGRYRSFAAEAAQP